MCDLEDRLEQAMRISRENQEGSAVESFLDKEAMDYAWEQQQSQPKPEDFNLSYEDASHGC